MPFCAWVPNAQKHSLVRIDFAVTVSLFVLETVEAAAIEHRLSQPFPLGQIADQLLDSVIAAAAAREDIVAAAAAAHRQHKR